MGWGQMRDKDEALSFTFPLLSFSFLVASLFLYHPILGFEEDHLYKLNFSCVARSICPPLYIFLSCHLTKKKYIDALCQLPPRLPFFFFFYMPLHDLYKGKIRGLSCYKKSKTCMFLYFTI